MAKTTPLDLVRPGTEFLSKRQAQERMDICHGCPHLHALVCGICHCVMPVKTRIAKSECPIGNWGEVPVNEKEAGE